jgi:hypothetical protein
MPAYLMLAPGQRPTFYLGEVVAVIHYPDLGDALSTSPSACRIAASARAGGQGPIPWPEVLRQMPLQQSQVPFSDRPLLKLLRQKTMNRRPAGQQDNPAGVLVQAMDGFYRPLRMIPYGPPNAIIALDCTPAKTDQILAWVIMNTQGGGFVNRQPAVTGSKNGQLVAEGRFVTGGQISHKPSLHDFRVRFNRLRRHIHDLKCMNLFFHYYLY